VSLRHLTAGRPTVLTINQYECRNLCPFVIEGVARGLRETGLTLGRDYAAITVGLDPREGPAVARRRKALILGGWLDPRSREAWHFLTGDKATIDRLAQAIGFRYAYDRAEDQFAHPSGLVVLTSGGTIARYLFGLDYPARDLRLALVEASRGRVGSVVDHVLLACYRYDAATGRYTPVVMNVVRAGGAVTLLGLVLGVGLLLRGERRRSGQPPTESTR
jgi:protein SCO1/2